MRLPIRAFATGRLVLLALLTLPPAAGPGGVANAQAEPTATRPDGVRAGPWSRRVLRQFDFEESETQLLEFPLHFRRDVATDRGFPPFGRLAPTREVAFAGNWSFGFELDGGSLSAEIPTGVLPVLPLADYVVTARVRTLGLEHARARLVACLYDAAGNPIPSTRHESRAVRTNGRWETLAITIDGDRVDAADLLVQLQLLQPRHLETKATHAREHEPVLDDVSGRAWFDDVTVWHLPRIDLSTQSPDNIIVQPDEPRLSLLVRDLADDDLTTRLRVTDLHGDVVFDDSFPAPRRRRPVPIAVPVSTCG